MAKAVEGPRDLIMPIREEYGEQIVRGLKRYEMRKHPCHAPKGSRLWVYAMASSRASHTGLFLGSMIYGGSVPFDTDADLRHIAVEAAATYELLDGSYLHGRRPAYGLRVQWYQRLLEPIEKTLSGMGIRRFPDGNLLRRLQEAAKTSPRRPLSRRDLEDGAPWLLKRQRLRTPSEKIVTALTTAGWRLTHREYDVDEGILSLTHQFSRRREKVEVEPYEDGNVIVWPGGEGSGDLDNPTPPLGSYSSAEAAVEALRRLGFLKRLSV